MNVNQNSEQAKLSAFVAVIRVAEIEAAGWMCMKFQNCALVSRIVVPRNRAAKGTVAADFFPEVTIVFSVPTNRV